MAHILIAGCGDVGTRLGVLLASRGHRVVGLRRHTEELPEEIEPFAADLTEPESLRRLARGLATGFDAVAYTAAAAGPTDDAYRRAYVDGPRNLLAALEAAGHGPRRLVYSSSTGVFGQTGGEWVDETSPTEPRAFTGRRVLEGEEIFRRSSTPSVALRLGGIYGPGRTRLLHRVAAGEAVCYEGPPSYTNRIHSDDAAGALAHLLEIEDPAPVYLGGDHEPAEICEVLRYLSRLLEVPPPRRVAAEQRPETRSSKRCSNRLLLESGYRFVFPTFREGYANLVAEWPERERAG